MFQWLDNTINHRLQLMCNNHNIICKYSQVTSHCIQGLECMFKIWICRAGVNCWGLIMYIVRWWTMMDSCGQFLTTYILSVLTMLTSFTGCTALSNCITRRSGCCNGNNGNCPSTMNNTSWWPSSFSFTCKNVRIP